MNNSINTIIPAEKVDMGGVLLDQPLPHSSLDQIDPFLLLHHWIRSYPGGSTQQNEGVGPHPHRGFSPITLIFKGGVHHRDSRGNESIISAGGTQWMDSGMGIIHSERPTRELVEEGGEFEIIQFWLNSPSNRKMEQPHYQPLSSENTPWVHLDDEKVKVGVVSGEFNETKGVISPKTPVLILRMEVKMGGKFDLPIQNRYNSFLYVLDGVILINGKETAATKDLVYLNKDGDNITIEAKSDTRFIFLSGEPINEKVVSHGPFVMNSETEIMEAIRDYQMGKMGILIENF
jgi:redox-sensitive bicupin YhaK (pirin superfamily)